MNARATLNAVFLMNAALAMTAVAEEDQIYMKQGTGLAGKVVGSTTTQVAIESRGTKRAVNVVEIRLITFGDEPQELRQGRASATGANFEAALQQLKRVDPSGIERGVIRQDLQFYLAYCQAKAALTSGGDKAKAAEDMLAFVRAAPTSYHFFDAARVLGDLAAGQGDYDGAVKFYGAIATKAPWPEYQMSAGLAQADALVAQEDFAAAQDKFESIMEQETDTPEANRQKLLAQVGKARCLAETDTPQAGIERIEQVIGENDATDVELFGRAYNAYGDCLRLAGRPADAMMAYLHVDVMFYSDPEIHAESLYHLSHLWSELNKSDRAAAARNLLESRYAGSAWAKKP